jgi:ubiquinone biosynthesis protein COQ9
LLLQEQKGYLAQAALKQVPEYGWTQDAITAAVLHNKMPISMSGMLTPSELVNWLMDDMNQQLKKQQQLDDDENENDDETHTTTLKKMKWRLQQVIPLVESGQWQHGMALGLTSTPLTTQSQLQEFIELVAPPDSSTLYKTALGGIFVATELHLLTDTSVEYVETWTFLELRLKDLDDGHHYFPSSGVLLDPTSIPMAATVAVASSLLEGITSLLSPPPSSSSSSPSSSGGGSSMIPGTKASDYATPPKNNVKA